MATGLTKTALTRHLAEKLELTNKQVAASSICWRRPRSRKRRRTVSSSSRHRPAREGRAQGAHRPQPPDWRGHQDQGQDSCEVPSGQGRQGRHRSRKK